MQLLSKTENSRISQLASVKQKLTSDYLTNQNDNQTAFIVAKYFKFDTTYLETINVSFNILNNIASIYNDYTAEPNTNFDVSVDGLAYDMCWAGYGVLVATVNEGVFGLQKVNPESYVKDSNNQERLLFAYETTQGDAVNNYILEKKYITTTTSSKNEDGIIIKQGKVEITNTLYKLTSKSDLTNATQVPLETLTYTADLPPVETMAIGRSPIFLFNNQRIDNDFYGNSEFDKFKSIAQSIEIQAVNIQDQLLKHLQAKLLLPRMALPTKTSTSGEKFIDLSKMEVLEVDEGQTFTPQYVSNTNDLIQHAFSYFELLMDRLCGVAQIPKELLSIKSEGGSEAYATKLVRFSVFLKKIERYRKIIEKQLKEIDVVRNQLGYGDGSQFVCVWEPVLPADDSVEITNIISLRTNGLMSKLKAIMQSQKLSLDEAEKELMLINDENVDISFESTTQSKDTEDSIDTNTDINTSK